MKNFFVTALILVLWIPSISFAQVLNSTQCGKLPNISSASQYNSCCTGVSKPAICFIDNPTKCAFGILPSSQCQAQCTNITSLPVYNTCCNGPLGSAPECANLSTLQLCMIGVPGTNCPISNPPPATGIQTYIPSVTYGSSQCAGFQSIDTSDKYNSCCVDINTHIPHTPQAAACATLQQNNLCTLGVAPLSQCQNQCSTIHSQSDFDSCCTGAIIANSCSTLTQAEKCLYNAYTNYTDWANAGCASYGAGVFAPPTIGTGHPLVPVTPLTLYGPQNTNTVVVETSCSKVNFSKVDTQSFWSFFLWIRCYIGRLLPILITIAFLVFMWNIVNYIIKPNALKTSERRTYIIAGLVGLFVIVAMWGIVAFSSKTLGLDAIVPRIPYSVQ
jgi:hypothetical protein